MFRHVTGKMGNMRKVVEWTVYPTQGEDDRNRTIQSDSRIAKINLDTGKAVLSKGRKGAAFIDLMAIRGATEVDCPQDIIDQLNNLDADHGTQSGPVCVMDENGVAPTVHARKGPVNIFDL